MLTLVRLKPIRKQVVVVTGASSGLGLATAELAASRGARVVLSSFDEPALREATERIRRRGGEATGLVADVTDRGALHHVAEVAARAVVRCMEKARRGLIIGGSGKVAVLMEKFAPTLTDEIRMRALAPLQRAKGPRREEDTLHTPRSHPREIERQDRHFVLRHSTYTWSVLHPVAAMAVAIAAVAGAVWLGSTPDLRRAAGRALRRLA